MALIDVKNLSFTYPMENKKALDDLNISIEQGEFVVICGSTGCGKSTFLKHLKRELTPHGKTEGHILYRGRDIKELDRRAAACEIGFVMQNPDNQVVTDKVWHELAFGLENLGIKTPVIRRRVAEMASFFGIQEWFRKKTSDLSGGQKQLLNLASIMVMNPRVLVLDEPTSQLDPIAASEFIDTLSKINKELSLTIVLVEHRLEKVFPIADKAVVMDKGRITYCDTPRNVGKKLAQDQYKKNNVMLWGMPAAVRVYSQIRTGGECPLTVREGRQWLAKNFDSHISRINANKKVKQPSRSVAVELKDVWFRYQRQLPDVLRGVWLKAYKGEIFSILGGNGTGKTTALGVIAGIYKAYRGKVLIKAKKINSYTDTRLYRNKLAMLPQNPQTMFVKDTVQDELKEVIRINKYDKHEAKQEFDAVVDQLNLSQLLRKHPYDLSGGEQQKTAFAKILLLRPKIILLDEPTKGIDAYSKAVLADILYKLKSKGVAIIIVTHDIEFSAEHSDRCALFFDGNIVSEDDPVTFFSHNSFYTTAANRMSRYIFENAVTCQDVIKLCKLNKKRVI
ncbi:MAG: energy-coupling factor transporter ATPase [Clostridia bacterium]|nr:energy-coupling factor transporter ATPase [Clostridia bacterium]